VSNKPNFKHRNRSAPVRTSPSRRIWEMPIAWLLGLIAVALIVTVAVAASNSDGGSTVVGDQTALVELRGDALPPFADPDEAVGRVVPAVSAQTLDGDRVQVLADGTARLFGFFAHWCPHCRAEMPRTAAWLRDNQLPEGVEVIAVSTGVEPTADNYPPSAWFAREQWPAQVLLDDDNNSLATAFGLTQYPYWVATNGAGEVTARATGELTTQQFEVLLASAVPGL
jgi:thiol-disulfide isomerase/thioredoxin